MLATLNAFFTSVFDLLTIPFQGIAPVWGLVFFSLVSGVILLVIYGWVSDQKAIANAKKKIHSYLLESILFRHDLSTSLRAQGRMFLQAGKYFSLAVPPILILAIPCIFILSQLNLRYQSEALHPGERSLMSITVAEPRMLFDVTVEGPEGIAFTPPVRIIDENRIVWGIEADQVGVYPATVKNGNGEVLFTKDLYVGVSAARLATYHARQWWMELLYPDDGRILAGAPAIGEILVQYPGTLHRFLGIEWHWLILFLVLSILSGLVAARYLKVEI